MDKLNKRRERIEGRVVKWEVDKEKLPNTNNREKTDRETAKRASGTCRTVTPVPEGDAGRG